MNNTRFVRFLAAMAAVTLTAGCDPAGTLPDDDDSAVAESSDGTLEEACDDSVEVTSVMLYLDIDGDGCIGNDETVWIREAICLDGSSDYYVGEQIVDELPGGQYTWLHEDLVCEDEEPVGDDDDDDDTTVGDDDDDTTVGDDDDDTSGDDDDDDDTSDVDWGNPANICADSGGVSFWVAFWFDRDFSGSLETAECDDTDADLWSAVAYCNAGGSQYWEPNIARIVVGERSAPWLAGSANCEQEPWLTE